MATRGRHKIYPNATARIRAWRQRRKHGTAVPETKGTVMTTKVLQSPDPDTSVEARSLTHVNAHPQMASILRKLFAMRERLAAVDTDIRAQRQENSVLEAQEVIAVAEL